MVDAYDDAFALNGAWASLAADARAEDRPSSTGAESSSESNSSTDTPKGWERCRDGGFVRADPLWGDEEPDEACELGAEKENVAAGLFQQIYEKTRDPRPPEKGEGGHEASPKSVISPDAVRPPILTGFQPEATDGRLSVEALERQWALAVQFDGVEVPYTFETGCDPCGDGTGCLMRRRSTGAAVAYPGQAVAPIPDAQPAVSDTPPTDAAFEDGVAAKDVWPVRVDAQAAGSSAGCSALHCLQEEVYKPPWSPRVGAGAPTGPWEWLVVEVHAMLGCRLVVDDSVARCGAVGTRPALPPRGR